MLVQPLQHNPEKSIKSQILTFFSNLQILQIVINLNI